MSKTYSDKLRWEAKNGKKNTAFQRLNEHVSRTARRLYFWKPERSDEHTQLHEAVKEANTADINNDEIDIKTGHEGFDAAYHGGHIPKN